MFSGTWQLMLRSSKVVRVAASLAWVFPGLDLGLSWWEQQFPEDGRTEGTKDGSVEVDDSPKGRPQLGELSAHQPEGSGQLWTPFSWAALQHGLEEALNPFSYVWWRGREGEKSGSPQQHTFKFKKHLWTEVTRPSLNETVKHVAPVDWNLLSEWRWTDRYIKPFLDRNVLLSTEGLCWSPCHVWILWTTPKQKMTTTNRVYVSSVICYKQMGSINKYFKK